MDVNIPKYTIGTDIETKDVAETAYILSIGVVIFNNYTLSVVGSLRVDFDPDDPEQSERTVSENTMEWWGNAHGDGCNRYPSLIAHSIAFGGKTKFNDGMSQYAKFLAQLPKDGKHVTPMRGPDFDYPILKHALRQTGNYKAPLYASPLDSHRTVERILEALDVPKINDSEVKRYWKGPPMPHVAIYDGALEGYETARMYHILYLIKTIGYDGMLEVIKSWDNEPAKDLKEYVND